MSIPKRIQIGSSVYDIKFIEHKNNSSLGSCSYTEKEIHLHKDQNHKTLLQTLWHEIIHAIFVELGEDELSNNEKLTTQLAHMIHGLHEQTEGMNNFSLE